MKDHTISGKFDVWILFATSKTIDMRKRRRVAFFLYPLAFFELQMTKSGLLYVYLHLHILDNKITQKYDSKIFN